MPSQKILSEKQKIVEALSEEMKTAAAGVLVEYKGINVADDTKLRADMRKSGVKYGVVKNTLTKLAAEKAGLEGLDEVLFGTTSLAISQEDVIAPAKIVCEFAKSNKNFKVKCGFMDGKVISADEVKALANIPSKEVLIGQLLGLLTSGLRGLAVTLNAIAEKGGAEAAEAPAEAATEAAAEATEASTEA